MRKKLYAVLSILFLLLSSSIPSFSAFAKGTLNVNLSVTPVNETTLSGQDALYRLDFKVTGVETTYTNAALKVEIPKGYELNTTDVPLEQLVINGITPTYDIATNILSYYFKSINAGQNYSYVLRVKTITGMEKNGAELDLKATFEASNLKGESMSDQGTVAIQSSNTINISKSYTRTENGTGTMLSRAPLTNDVGVWNIKVSSAVKKAGLQYFKEGTTLTVVDKLPAGLTYVSDDLNVGTRTISGQTITWKISAPTIAEQKGALDNLFSIDFNVKTKIISKINFDKLENTVTVSGTAIDETITTNTSSYTIGTGMSDPSSATSSGANRPVINLEAKTAGGYKDVKSNMAISNEANLALWDDDIWTTGIQMASENMTSQTKDFTKTTVTYTPDRALYLQSINTGKYTQRWGVNGNPNTPLIGSQHPVMDINLTINGTNYLFVSNATDDTEYPLDTFLRSKGLPLTSRVTKIIYNYRYVPPGINGRFFMTWSIEKGTNRQISNTALFDMAGYDSAGKVAVFKNTNTLNDASSYNGVRKASVTARPAIKDPTASTGIAFEKQANGVVNVGKNRAVGSFTNVASSSSNLTKNLSAIVILPRGVSVDSDNPNYEVKNGFDNVTGTVAILDSNFDGKGHQKILIKWDDATLTSGKSLTYGFNVNIASSTESPLEIYTYGGSGNISLLVPTTPSSITDSSTVIDSDDLNGNGNTIETLIKSGNKYTVLTDSSLVVTKSVKGNLDKNFSNMGLVNPGGNIDYQINIGKRNSSQAIEKFEYIDVLPSVDDLGISDNIARNSKFTPVMEGPIIIPDEWKDKVTVSYSKSKNPTRYSLYYQSDYSNGAAQYTNPVTAENPGWMLKEGVGNWSEIHSYAIRLNDGVIWSNITDFSFTFNMRAPTVDELKANGESTILADNVIGDPTTISEKNRTAWNSFAYRENNLQMIEPLKVGVTMTNYTGEIYLLKYLNENSLSEQPKIDSEYRLLNEKGLKGAEFNLVDSDGKIVVQATTNDQGQIHFKNVWFGDYTLIETKAPEGYELFKEPIKVSVSSSSNNGIGIAFAGDDPITVLPDAGGEGGPLLTLIIFSSLSLIGLISFGSMYLVRKKEKRK